MAATNSTAALMKLVTQGVSNATNSAQTKISFGAAKKATLKANKFNRRVGNETPQNVVSRLTAGNEMSDSKMDTTELGSIYIQGKEGTTLANAPSIGVNMTARLKRLSQSVEPKLQKVVAGLNDKINPISTSPVYMINKKQSKRRN